MLYHTVLGRKCVLDNPVTLSRAMFIIELSVNTHQVYFLATSKPSFVAQC